MNKLQINLIKQLIDAILLQLSDKETTILKRVLIPDLCRLNLPEVYIKILNTINQGIINELKTPELDRAEYWAEFILEIMWAKVNKLEEPIQNRYNYWRSYKIQNFNKLLKDKSYI